MIEDIINFASGNPELYVGGLCFVGLILILVGGLSGGSGRR